jgi:hypothetical protein
MWCKMTDVTCPVCRGKVAMNTMRYNLEGTKLVCMKCYEKEASFKKERKFVTRVERK